MNFRTGQPFVGPSAFAHKGGMHAHAVAKDPASYEHIDPERGRQRAPDPRVSELSGQSTILAKTAKYADRPRQGADGEDPRPRCRTWRTQGYEFEAAEASFDLLVKKAAGLYKPRFERLAYRVNVEARENGTPVTEATVKLRVGGPGRAHRRAKATAR